MKRYHRSKESKVPVCAVCGTFIPDILLGCYCSKCDKFICSDCTKFENSQNILCNYCSMQELIEGEE